MLKLKLQYFGHLMQRANSLEKVLMLGKPEGRRGQQRMRWLDSISDSMDMNLSKFWGIMKDRGAWCAGVHIGHDLATEPPGNQALGQELLQPEYFLTVLFLLNS